jgi:hypothetical protein
VKNGAEFRNAFDPEDLGFETIVQPPEPADLNSPLMVKQWVFAYKTYYNQVYLRVIASGQAFAVVLGQCSPAIVDRVQAHEDWEETSEANDVIRLLQLIRTCMYGGATMKYLEHTIIDAQTKLLTFHQSSRMSNAKYLHSFRGMVDAIEYLGGEVGVEALRITAHLEQTQRDPDDPDEWAAARQRFVNSIWVHCLSSRVTPNAMGRSLPHFK